MNKPWTVLKLIAIAAGVLVLILLLVVATWVSRSAARLEKRIEAVRAAGDPLSLAELGARNAPSLAELAGQLIAPERNAALYLHVSWYRAPD